MRVIYGKKLYVKSLKLKMNNVVDFCVNVIFGSV